MPIIAISLFNEIGGLMSPMVLFETVWLESPAGLAKVVEGSGGSGGPWRLPGKTGQFF